MGSNPSRDTLTMTNTTVDLEVDVPMFQISNTSSLINLNGRNTLNASSEQLISAGTGRWGNDGSNGGGLTINIMGDEFGGSITADDISSVAVSTTEGGAFNGITYRELSTFADSFRKGKQIIGQTCLGQQ